MINRARAQAVSAAIAKVPHLAMLPEVAVRVVKLANDPDSTVDVMAETISRSPELSTRILKVVNSAFYGLPRQVSSVHRAVSLIGLESAKNVAIAASLTRVFQGPPVSAKFSPRDLWVHSMAVAAAARLIATTTKTQLADEAFLAGLIHDIGLMLELQYDRNKLRSVLARLETDDTGDLLAVEEQHFEANHQDFGGGLAERWQLPPTLSCSTGWHHVPLQAPKMQRTLVTMVHVADQLVANHQPGFPFDAPFSGIDDDALDQLQLTRGQLDTITADLPAAVAEVTAFLSAT